MTTHKVLRIDVAELTLLRLTCRNCEGTIELPVTEVSRRLRSSHCPFCNAAFFATARAPNPATQLALAIAEVLHDADHVRAEFVLPVEE